jgi:hypothetical protein
MIAGTERSGQISLHMDAIARLSMEKESGVLNVGVHVGSG